MRLTVPRIVHPPPVNDSNAQGNQADPWFFRRAVHVNFPPRSA